MLDQSAMISIGVTEPFASPFLLPPDVRRRAAPVPRYSYALGGAESHAQSPIESPGGSAMPNGRSSLSSIP